MTSERKIAANRANARKSRGPKSEIGKQRASRNALRHGLAAVHPAHVVAPEIKQMATAICDGDANSLLFDQAVAIAESELMLQSVRMQKLAIIERLYDPYLCALSKGDKRFEMADLRIRQSHIAYAELCRICAKLREQGETVITFVLLREPHPNDPVVKYEEITRDEHDAIQEGLPDLWRLLRYEQRAWARRKKALYRFITMKQTSRPPAVGRLITTGAVQIGGDGNN